MNVTDDRQIVPSGDHDIIVLSDLHMGEGKKPKSSRYASTEDFFYDDAIARFFRFLVEKYKSDPSKLKLVLNGDILDFLTVVNVPSREEARRRGFEVSSSEKKFGLNATEKKSIYKLDVIFDGHTTVFHALSRFVAAGHQLVFVRGNHDLELHFEGVQNHILYLLSGFYDGADLESLQKRVSFHMLFYQEKKRVHIEHGNQYDSTNSIRYPLSPIQFEKSFWRRDEEADEMLDYPLGSIFVKFFYNRVRRLDPHAPRLLSPRQYVDFVRRYNIFDVWKVYKDHYPYFIAALGPSAPTGGSIISEETDARHQTLMEELGKKSGQESLVDRWHEQKIHPESASKLAIVREMAEPIVRRTVWFTILAIVSICLWLIVFQLIQIVPPFAARPILMTLFTVFTLGGAAWAWIHLRRKLSVKGGRKEVVTCAEGAEKLADIMTVPLVLMGHTHFVDIRELKNGAVYANSGTWTSVNNPWNRIMRDARRLTFLYVQGTEVELRRWNDDACRFDEVPLFRLDHDGDRYDDDALSRASIPPNPPWDHHEHSDYPSNLLEPDEEEVERIED